jgi:hypothetical protein
MTERLLTDIRDAFAALRVERVRSVQLAEYLRGIEAAPWGEWARGKGLNANHLAALLEPLGIGPQATKIDGKTCRGYRLEQFTDTFARNLSSACNGVTVVEDEGLRSDQRSVTIEDGLHHE